MNNHNRQPQPRVWGHVPLGGQRLIQPTLVRGTLNAGTGSFAWMGMSHQAPMVQAPPSGPTINISGRGNTYAPVTTTNDASNGGHIGSFTKTSNNTSNTAGAARPAEAQRTMPNKKPKVVYDLRFDDEVDTTMGEEVDDHLRGSTALAALSKASISKTHSLSSKAKTPEERQLAYAAYGELQAQGLSNADCLDYIIEKGGPSRFVT